VCGTAAEVIGLREIDFRAIGDGKAGPVTRALQQEFDKLVSGRHARSTEWLAPVPALNAAAVRTQQSSSRFSVLSSQFSEKRETDLTEN
jgi:hypothetical protein